MINICTFLSQSIFCWVKKRSNRTVLYHCHTLTLLTVVSNQPPPPLKVWIPSQVNKPTQQRPFDNHRSNVILVNRQIFDHGENLNCCHRLRNTNNLLQNINFYLNSLFLVHVCCGTQSFSI